MIAVDVVFLGFMLTIMPFFFFGVLNRGTVVISVVNFALILGLLIPLIYVYRRCEKRR